MSKIIRWLNEFSRSFEKKPWKIARELTVPLDEFFGQNLSNRTEVVRNFRFWDILLYTHKYRC